MASPVLKLLARAAIVLFYVNVSFLSTTVAVPVYSMSIDNGNNANPVDDYMLQRNNLLAAEEHVRVGGQIVLTADEKRVNSHLLQMKKKEVDASLLNGVPFPPKESFIRSKSAIEKSDVFRFLRDMPKGAALHVHDISLVDIDWLVNVTYRDNCYMCYDANHDISFHFFQTPPANPGCPWKLVSELRGQSADQKMFDDLLRDSMLITDDFVDRNITIVWKHFEDILNRANGLIAHTPILRGYFYEALRIFNEDNVQYLENRALLGELYELDGTVRDAEFVMELYKNVTEQFKGDHPEFTGARIIKTNLRFLPVSDILADVKQSITFMEKFPDHFSGYDLVGQEDPGKPLLFYLQDLLYKSEQTPPASLPYFFHAGETNYQGTYVDDNLIDAVLLNTSRIGHGYALNKHPIVKEMVKTNKIAIEVNPISNQVLKLVDNLQNHPAAGFIAEGLPVVISSDDPSVWGARGLSHDFYMMFMGLAGETDGLSLLKQLAMNSLTYSTMPQPNKLAAIKAWEAKWNTFIQQEVKKLNHSGTF